MQSFLLALHFILAVSLIGLILLQKHDSDGALGSGGSGAGSGMFSVRGQANLLTRTTAILMTIFIVNCLLLARLHKHKPADGSLIDKVAVDTSAPISKKKINVATETPPETGDEVQQNADASSIETQESDSASENSAAGSEQIPDPGKTAAPDETAAIPGEVATPDETVSVQDETSPANEMLASDEMSENTAMETEQNPDLARIAMRDEATAMQEETWSSDETLENNAAVETEQNPDLARIAMQNEAPLPDEARATSSAFASQSMEEPDAENNFEQNANNSRNFTQENENIQQEKARLKQKNQNAKKKKRNRRRNNRG
ncbi:MAG: preprotein translocase subunit SecG [Holosporaceae bacterium]|jgi:preprotein translocase subunit SecG|nr:preprotein translocase subunit SecG [Holosporaceae bacterium]